MQLYKKIDLKDLVIVSKQVSLLADFYTTNF